MPIKYYSKNKLSVCIFTLSVFLISLFSLLILPANVSAITEDENEFKEKEAQDIEAYKAQVEAKKKEALESATEANAQKLEVVQTQLQGEDATGIKEIKKQIQQEKKDGIQEMKQEKESKYEALKLKWAEKTQLKEEKMTAKLDEAQMKKLTLVKKHSALSEARIQKSIEHLYHTLDQIDKHLTTQEEAGFDVTTQRTQLEALETDIAALETALAPFVEQYADLETLSVEELKTVIPQMKQDVGSIVSDLHDLKLEVIGLIKTIK